MNITTVKELIAALRSGPYTSIGSYPVFFYTKDSGILSFKTVKENVLLIGRAIRDDNDPQWCVIGTDINWENPEMYCSDSNERIEPAYSEF